MKPTAEAAGERAAERPESDELLPAMKPTAEAAGESEQASQTHLPSVVPQ